jgi:pimeloyl-ACP methyl ester carboxylesterase
MFSSTILKGALCAFAVMDMTVQGTTSPEDIANYQEFAAIMGIEGFNYAFKSYPMTTASGYEIVMFRITADPTGAPLVPTKGPLLILHGMFSDPTDFFQQSNPAAPGLPVQLAMDGYDVWIGCTRGRDITLNHATIDKSTPESRFDYWNFSFEDIGREDVSSMVDTIIASRNQTDECKKVTIVTHSTGANAALVAATDTGV